MRTRIYSFFGRNLELKSNAVAMNVAVDDAIAKAQQRAEEHAASAATIFAEFLTKPDAQDNAKESDKAVEAGEAVAADESSEEYDFSKPPRSPSPSAVLNPPKRKSAGSKDAVDDADEMEYYQTENDAKKPRRKRRRGGKNAQWYTELLKNKATMEDDAFKAWLRENPKPHETGKDDKSKGKGKQGNET